MKPTGALGAVLVAVLSGSLLMACTSSDSGTIVMPSPHTPSGVDGVAVRVTVVDVEGSDGGSVAGVLSKGSGWEAVLPSRVPEDPADHWIGGFGVAVDADPFTTTQTANAPSLGPLDVVTENPFPHVSDTPLMVEPGTYTLMLWAQDRPLSMYSRWVPSRDGFLRGCWVTFEVAARIGATVTVTGIPEMVDSDTEFRNAGCSTG